MQRNSVVRLCSSFVGLGIVLILLSATGHVGARGADVRSDAPLVAQAADGDLDPTFGSGGKVTTDFNGTDVANALAIQSDGKIVVAGHGLQHTVGDPSDFAVAQPYARVTTGVGTDQLWEALRQWGAATLTGRERL
jgi:hypothetical protein